MSSSKKIQRILHPASSPNLAPSDFFLFCSIKRQDFAEEFGWRWEVRTCLGDEAEKKSYRN
jgi:hypothetical protein